MEKKLEKGLGNNFRKVKVHLAKFSQGQIHLAKMPFSQGEIFTLRKWSLLGSHTLSSMYFDPIRSRTECLASQDTSLEYGKLGYDSNPEEKHENLPQKKVKLITKGLNELIGLSVHDYNPKVLITPIIGLTK